MLPKHSTSIYPANDPHGKTPDGHGKGFDGLGATAHGCADEMEG